MTSTVVCLAGALLAVTAGREFRATETGIEEVHHSYALSAHGRITLNNINGDVRIVAWDRLQVRLDAVKRGSPGERLRGARVVVDARPEAIAIRTRYEADDPDGHPATVDYTVMVPREARLDDIRLVNGRLDIEGVTGTVRATAVNGPVKAKNLAGDARLSTVNGRLEATFDRLDRSRAIDLDSVNGIIVLLIPADARAAVEASNVAGGISNAFGLPVDHGVGSRLSALLKGGGTNIKLHNVNGGISISAVSYQLSAVNF